MLKVKPADSYPPEEGRYVRGNDYSPVAVCVILDTFDSAIPSELNEMVMAGVDAGAAISGMLQTENIGLEKVICNIVANPNIRYIVLCGRESNGHLPGESLLALKQNGVDDKKHIIGSEAPTPYLSNISLEVIGRFNKQIVSIINLLCQPGESDVRTPGLSPKVIEKAVWSCYQENPVIFMGHTLYDMGAYPEPAILHKIVSRLAQPQQSMEPGKANLSMGFTLQRLLPRTNCRKCGKPTCLAFAIELVRGKVCLEDCPLLDQPEYAADRQALAKLLK
ncbi:MAG: tetrahydromethanopterin S-methyltransferase subunit A [Chloroflexi bacterium]|nr:tetrahydromethanopterin S-methyltransferase subunit A [Chloroflexota bacterium]